MFQCFYLLRRCFCLDNVYRELKKMAKGNEEIKGLFTKEKVIMGKSETDIYREIAFGEMSILQEEKVPYLKR